MPEIGIATGDNAGHMRQFSVIFAKLIWSGMLNSCVNGYNGFRSATTKIKASESKHDHV